MPIRMTGIVSNLDTDTIVKELMAAQSQKKVKIENKITKNEWTTEKWEALNSKMLSFYKGILTKVKNQGQYKSKNATSSDESKLTATAGMNAVNGSHSVEVVRLAASQNMTSAQLADYTASDGTTKSVTAATKLTELGNGSAWSTNSTVNIKNGDKEINLDITADTTVGDFVNACKSAGLTASFDAAQKRIFINSSKSGEDSKFSITTSSTNGAVVTAKNTLRTQLGYATASSATRTTIDKMIDTYVAADWGGQDENTSLDKLHSILDKAVTTKYTDQLKSDWKNGAAMDTVLRQKMDDAAAAAEQKYRDSLTAGQTADPDRIDAVKLEAVTKVAKDYLAEKKTEFEAGTGSNASNPYYQERTIFDQGLEDFKTLCFNLDSTGTGGVSQADALTASDAKLATLGLVTVKNGTVDPSSSRPSGMGFVEACDSLIKYNGAAIQSSTNEVSVNNLTLNLKGSTAGQTVDIAVSNNTDGIYEMVKEFVTGYNEVLEELNDAYNAKSSRGYEPLTSEQKDAMTDEEVEKWENKIKDSLLRRDDKISGILSVMKNSIQGNVTVNGKKYSLASFGIGAPLYTEKGTLHIDGDPEDALRADEKEKLKKAINQDPDAVMKVITTLTSNLYDGLKDKMKTNTMSSSMKFYNDKQFTKDLDSYKKELKAMEKKLQEMEDRYYKQFSAMETALSKLNSQSNSLSSIIGSN